MTAQMQGPAWYWIAGTAALVLWAWVLLGVAVGIAYEAWNRAQARRERAR